MTPGARRVLEELAADENCDLIQEGNVVYCGPRQTTARVVNELLNILAIGILYRDGFRGRSLLRRPELEGEIMKVLYTKGRRPFQIVDDQIRYL